MPKEDTIELRWIFEVVRRYVWLIVGCTILMVAIAFLVSSRTAPVYGASSTLLVDRAQASGGSDYNDIRASELLASTYGQMVTGRPVLGAALAQLGLTQSPGSLARRVKVEPIPGTPLIRLSVEDTNPTRAALLANTIAEAFVNQMMVLQAQRYEESLTRMQERMDELSPLIDETQATIDTLRASRIRAETQLVRQEAVLAEHRADQRALQRDYEQLQLAAVQSLEEVSVVEIADYTAILASEQLAGTYSSLLTARPVLEAVIEELELEESADTLAERVTGEPVAGTQLIRIDVADEDPDQARLIAATVAEVFVDQLQLLGEAPYAELLSGLQEQVDDLETLAGSTQRQIDTLTEQRIEAETELARQEADLAQYRSDFGALQRDYEDLRLTVAQATDSVEIFEPAEVNRSPIRPQTMTNMMLAGAIGVALGGGLAFLLEYLNDAIRTRDDVRRALGQDTLAVVGRLQDEEKELVAASRPLSAIGQAFRVLNTNFRFLSTEEPLHTVLVTSPGGQEGKSLTAANFAVTMARARLNVVVVDADVYRPRLHKVFGVEHRGELTEALLTGSVDGRLQPALVDEAPLEGLRILTSDRVPFELLGSQRIGELMHELAGQADVVVVDGPPMLPVADAAALAASVDGVLLVLRAGRTRRRAAREALESLQRAGANVLGVVLNGAATERDRYYEEYYVTPRVGGETLERLLGLLRRVLAWVRESLLGERGLGSLRRIPAWVRESLLKKRRPEQGTESGQGSG
jgi:non-specific protein-tyrosine kinase